MLPVTESHWVIGPVGSDDHANGNCTVMYGNCTVTHDTCNVTFKVSVL